MEDCGKGGGNGIGWRMVMWGGGGDRMEDGDVGGIGWRMVVWGGGGVERLQVHRVSVVTCGVKPGSETQANERKSMAAHIFDRSTLFTVGKLLA